MHKLSCGISSPQVWPFFHEQPFVLITSGDTSTAWLTCSKSRCTLLWLITVTRKLMQRSQYYTLNNSVYSTCTGTLAVRTGAVPTCGTWSAHENWEPEMLLRAIYTPYFCLKIYVSCHFPSLRLSWIQICASESQCKDLQQSVLLLGELTSRLTPKLQAQF